MSFLSSLVSSPSATQGLKERQKTCGQPDCRRLAPRSASDRTVRFSGAAQPPWTTPPRGGRFGVLGVGTWGVDEVRWAHKELTYDPRSQNGL